MDVKYDGPLEDNQRPQDKQDPFITMGKYFSYGWSLSIWCFLTEKESIAELKLK